MKKHSYLKVLLNEQSITYKKLARELDISVPTLSNKINGKAFFNLEEAEAILRILDVRDCHDKCKLLNI